MHRRPIVTIDEKNTLWEGVIEMKGEELFAVYDGNPDNCEVISYRDACDDISMATKITTIPPIIVQISIRKFSDFFL
jgi:hypothetical protein